MRALAGAPLLARSGLVFAVAHYGFGRQSLLHGPDTRRYTRPDRERMVATFEQIPPRVLAPLTREVSHARGAPGDRLDRCTIVVSDDDPLLDEATALAAIAELGLPSRSVAVISGGGLVSHGHHQECPGTTTRNVDELAHIVESMLVSSREGAPLSTRVASTVLAGSEDGASR